MPAPPRLAPSVLTHPLVALLPRPQCERENKARDERRKTRRKEKKDIMAEVNPKAYPLADAQLTITILDIVQQAAVRARQQPNGGKGGAIFFIFFEE